jgi:hypothetical protein
MSAIKFKIESESYFRRCFRTLPKHYFLFRFIALAITLVLVKVLPAFDWRNFLFIISLLLLANILLVLILIFFVGRRFLTLVALEKDLLKIEYLDFNESKSIVIPRDELTYRLYIGSWWFKYTGLDFLKNDKVVMNQLSYAKWSVSQMKEITKSLQNEGVKKPFGENM